jgi:hypothetical protein
MTADWHLPALESYCARFAAKRDDMAAYPQYACRHPPGPGEAPGLVTA